MESEEFKVLRSQIVTSKSETRGGRQYAPYVFTEQGCAMLSSVLKSGATVKVSIQIMDAFVAMRRFLRSNINLFDEIVDIKQHQLISDKRIDELRVRDSWLFVDSGDFE